MGIKMISAKYQKYALIAVAAGVALYVIKKGSLGAAAAGVTAGVVTGAADIVGGALAGAVIGAGEVVGVPQTDLDKCKACIRAGDNFGASKYCTAGQFATWQGLSLRKKLFGTSFTLNDIFN